MIEWMIMPLKRYFEFNGRSRRKEFWSFALLNVIVYFVLFAIMAAGGLPLGALDNPSASAAFGPIAWLGLALLALWALAIVIPSIAVAVRRLHDRDMSGWWYLGVIIVSMIPFIGIFASIGFLVLMALPGTDGPNRYGPDPKDPSNAEVFA